MTKEQILESIIDLWSPDFQTSLEKLITEYKFDLFIKENLRKIAEEDEAACGDWKNEPDDPEASERLWKAVMDRISAQETRSPDRIEPFLQEFGRVWKEKYPDMRFGQLLYGFFCAIGDPFYIEDDKLLEAFKNYCNGNFDK